MSKIRILEKEEIQQNDFYDSSKSNDGGGYYQPCRVTLFEYEGKIYKFVYNDTSCGDFGDRFTKTLYLDDKVLAQLEVDQVSDDVWNSDFTWSNPLHVALYNAGLLKKWNFYDEEQE